MYAIKLSVFFCLGLAGFTWQNEQIPRVDTHLGNISGYYKTSQFGKKYEAYEGIPYAEPPVGKLRFEPPRPAQRWGNELPAKKKSSPCMQFLMSFEAKGEDRVIGCEDCLYMNIYVSIRNNNEELLPVIFWIHGGAFQFGTGNQADEKRIMDRNIVLVTSNYRLGPFGFLSTEDSVVPGNMGLKDQSLALRWVYDNIENFGGDSKEITLLGLSAGGTSVHYHYMSPLSAGLFQRGISISGVTLNPRSQTRHASKKAKKLASLMGCSSDTSENMIACLKARPPRVISQAVGNFMHWLYNPATPFGPVVEKQGSNPFINRPPIEIISSGDVLDVPWITGIVSEEGLYPSAEYVANDNLLKELNDNWDDLAPYILNFNDSIPLKEHKQVAEKIREFYFGREKIDSDTVMTLIHMIGDRSFGVGFEKASRLQAKVNKSPVWTYYYSYRAQHSFSEAMSGSNKNFGVSHGDDLFLVLDKTISNTTKPDDLKMQEYLIDFYTSFAIEGIPNIGHAKWEPLNSDQDFRYLHIANLTSISMESSRNFAEKDFWSTIHIYEKDQLSQKISSKYGAT
ncbi:Venom carboxylesterase-6 [Habropoda laboriosa]|uniref:Carboxylic ester hydrolase n=1 Tax=Habropoda laboriosa TaxID=597456 RepID=A0A0L7QZ41_9HYME|nr:PREDICTED: venom carboxylesterase-6-like [Habropoda laboriosa]KOC63848.1 Venom carboxylesterase-6 [Habropoda laboriosa]